MRLSARAAHRGGADAVSLINTINSITSVDLERMVALPVVGSQSTHGGYCGSAVKPIALNMVAEIARDPLTKGLPISGIGGIGSWRDAAEFIAMGCGSIQVCTAAMLHGFRIVDEMKDGLSRWMDSQGYTCLDDFCGRAVSNTTDWKYLDINYQVIAKIDQDACIGCGRCHIACEDTAHQAIASLKQPDGTHRYEVIDDECVGCNLCRSPARSRLVSRWCLTTMACRSWTGTMTRVIRIGWLRRMQGGVATAEGTRLLHPLHPTKFYGSNPIPRRITLVTVCSARSNWISDKG